MSTEANSNNNEISPQKPNLINNNESKMLNKEKEEKIKIEYELKQIKDKLKSLLKSSLAKNLLNLETKTKEHIQILTLTTKVYNEFDKKIKLMVKQVEENKKKKEEKLKAKKLKPSSSKKGVKRFKM